MPTNRQSKEIAAAGVSLLCDRHENRSPSTNTDVGLSLFTTDWKKKKNGNRQHVGADDFYVTLALGKAVLEH